MPTLPSDEDLVKDKFAQHLEGTRAALVERVLAWAQGDRDRRAFVLAADAGAWAVRVHDVVATRDALTIARAWQEGKA